MRHVAATPLRQLAAPSGEARATPVGADTP